MDRQNNLVRWASKQIGKKYEWGKIDCVSLALQGLREMYGDETFNDLPVWNSEISALKTYSEFESVVKFLENKGWIKIHQNYARTGDIIILDSSPLQTAVIVINGRGLIIDPERGVRLSSISALENLIGCFHKGR